MSITSRRGMVDAHKGDWIARPAQAGDAPSPAEIWLKRTELLEWLPASDGGLPPLRLVRVTATVLNVRERPTTVSARIGQLKRGDQITVTVAESASGGLQWSQIYREGLPGGWLAIAYTEPVQPKPGGGGAPPRNLIGWHVAGGHLPPNLLWYIQQLAAADTPLRAIVVVAQPQLCANVKQISPRTHVTYRHWIGEDRFNPATANPNRWETGEEWLARFLPHIANVPADAFQFANEWYHFALTRGDVARYGQFYIELMQACKMRGITCTVGDFNVGHVEPHEVAALSPMFETAERLGMVLNYHAYSTEEGDDTDMHADAPFYALRWVEWVRPFPNLRVLLGEAGKYHAPRFVNISTTLRMMRDHAEQLAPYADRLIGSCWWTLAGEPGGWGKDDFMGALDNVFQWLKG